MAKKKKSEQFRYFIYISAFILVLLFLILLKTVSERYYPSLSTIVSFNSSLRQQSMNSSKNYSYANGVINKYFQFNAHGPVISTPSVVNGVIYFGTNKDQVYALSATTGKLIWKITVDNMVMTEPLVVKGMVYIGTGNNAYKKVGGKTVRGAGNNAIYALSSSSGKVIWMKSTNGENMPSFAYKKGNIYVANGGAHFYSINAMTGNVNWRLKLKGYVSMSSMDLSGNVAYFGEGKPLQTQYVAAVNIKTKKILWQKPMPDSFGGVTDCSPSSNSQYLVISGLGLSPTPNKFYEILYVLSKKTGDVVWTHILGFGPNPFAMETSSPIIIGNNIYVGNPVGKGKFYSFNINTGDLNWVIKIYGVQKGASVYSNGILYFGDGFDNFYAVKASNGDVLGVHRFGVGKIAQFTAANPALVNNEIYMGSDNGYLYAFPDTYLYQYNYEFIKYSVWSLFYHVFGVRW